VLEPLLTGRFGRPYLYCERCEETQDLLESTLNEGAIAVCEEQTAGTWTAPPRAAILCSALLRPPPERAVGELSLVGAVATAEAVEAALALSAQIKWPNDVMVDRRKVASIQLESRNGAVLLGFELNVNQNRSDLPEGLRVPAASLLTIDARRRTRAPLLADLLVRLECAYDGWCEGGLDALYVGLGARDFLRGRKVSVDGHTGIAVAVDRAGRLEVDVGGEMRFVETARVTYER
jgi:BirA family biotin operon repressor/biotin-[acetyl-CoA-carboxylase] ligase